MLSSYHFRDMYEEMGVPWDDPYCVMLKTAPIFLEDIPEEALHYSKTQKYAQGHVSKDKPHSTLLYGLLPPTRRSHVDRVLEGWSLDQVAIKDIEIFEPAGQEYDVVVASLWDEGLLEAHQRLSFLPHISTHPTFKPHITICYVEKGWAKPVRQICRKLIGAEFKTYGIDYGDTPE